MRWHAPQPALLCHSRPPARLPNKCHGCSPHTLTRSSPPLTWDNKLAAKAQAHANTCRWGHSDGRQLAGSGESIVSSGVACVWLVGGIGLKGSALCPALIGLHSALYAAPPDAHQKLKHQPTFQLRPATLAVH